MDDRNRTGRPNRGYSGQYMSLGMIFGISLGLLLLQSNWPIAMCLGMALGSLLDWQQSSARSR